MSASVVSIYIEFTALNISNFVSITPGITLATSMFLRFPKYDDMMTRSLSVHSVSLILHTTKATVNLIKSVYYLNLGLGEKSAFILN